MMPILWLLHPPLATGFNLYVPIARINAVRNGSGVLNCRATEPLDASRHMLHNHLQLQPVPMNHFVIVHCGKSSCTFSRFYSEFELRHVVVVPWVALPNGLWSAGNADVFAGTPKIMKGLR